MSNNGNGITYGVMGWPVKQSLSPEIHNHWITQQDIKERYGLLEIEPKHLKENTAQLVVSGLKGFNVTVPHKIAIMAELDDIDDIAKIVGAVNTVTVGEDGKLSGTNTDVYGFLHNLKLKAPNWCADKPALILGAGGAARAAVYGLLQAGVPKVYITNRTLSKAEGLSREFGSDVVMPILWESRESVVGDVALIVNTTTLGMAGCAELEFDLTAAQKQTVIYDIVYKPLMTNLLLDAEARGLNIVTGFGMLVHQAAAAFNIWFGRYPDLSDGFTDDLEGRFK